MNIKITDINDKNPEFERAPYNFKVKEGRSNTSVGFVHATDADEGINALITYSIPYDVPFLINPETGEIVTKMALDYETQKVKNKTWKLNSLILIQNTIVASEVVL